MKILNLTKLKLLYVNLIAVAFFLPSCGGVVWGVNAQTSDILLNSNWQLIESSVNGNPILIQNLGGSQFYSPHLDDYFQHEYGNSCFETLKVTFTDMTQTSFNLDTIIEYISCNYTDPDEIAAIELYQSFYFELPIVTNGTPKNPFTYTWVNNGFPVDDLIITNPDGDWLLYRTAFLSTPTFHQNSFTLYPSPVKETLQVNNSSNQLVSVTIYDINGKKLQHHSLETSASTIDVKALNQGVYFVVFESEAGERVSKKFVKN